MALENKVFSAPINIVRYNNGTMLKLASGTHEFISYNYDAEKKQGRFEPDTITITATLKGDLVIAGWKYSTDGITWKDAVSGKNGITIGERTLTVAATSDLFADTNSSITFMCSATAGGYYDTLTITRTIDPIVMFQKTYTAIEQTQHKISMIASDEEIASFQESSMYKQLNSTIEETAEGIRTEVSAKYATTGAVNALETRVSNLDQGPDSITAQVSKLTNKVDNTLASDVLWYWACNKETGVQVDTQGAKWTTEPASPDAKMSTENKYLWMYHEYTYNDTTGTKSNSTPGIVGVYGETGSTGPQGGTGPQGDTGVGISKVEPLYYATDTDQAPNQPQIQIEETRPLYGTWTLGIPSIDNDHPYMYMCDQITYDTSPASYNWSDVVRDNASISFQERLNSAELKITDEAIISTVRSEYGEVSKVGINLLLDTNAPTLAHVDAKADRTASSSYATVNWVSVSNAPDGITYGLECSGSGNNCQSQINWYRDSVYAEDYVHNIKPGNKYTIKYYVGNLYVNPSRDFDFDKISTYFYMCGRSSNYTIPTTNMVKRTIETTGGDVWEERSVVFTAPADSRYYYDLNNGDTCIRFTTYMSSYADGYSYRYRICGFMLSDGEDATVWNDGIHFELATNNSVESQIMQTADAIRMKATTIAWEAENSSMTEDGKLICNEAEISGKFTAGNKGNYIIEIVDNVIYFKRKSTGSIVGYIQGDVFESEQSDGLFINSDTGPVLLYGDGAQVCVNPDSQEAFMSAHSAGITADNDAYIRSEGNIYLNCNRLVINNTYGYNGVLNFRAADGGTIKLDIRNGIIC